MGSGSSAHARSETDQTDEFAASGTGAGAPRMSPTPLSYMDKHIPLPEHRKTLNKERFARVLRIVRSGAKSMDALSNTTLARRKREIAAQVAEAVQNDQEQVTELIRSLNERENAGLDLPGAEGSEEELTASKNMLFGMIGYELSSSDDEYDVEEHDINAPVSSDSGADPAELSHRGVIIKRLSNFDSDGDGGTTDQHSPSSLEGEKSLAGELLGDSDSDEACGKEDNCRTSSRTCGTDTDMSAPHCNLTSNHEALRAKRKQHALHSIMREESMSERKVRATLKLERRKKRSQLKKRNNTHAGELPGRPGGGVEVKQQEEEEVLDSATFEAKKNMRKEFKAYECQRKVSVAQREGRQRESLARRLARRKQQLLLRVSEEGTVAD